MHAKPKCWHARCETSLEARTAATARLNLLRIRIQSRRASYSKEDSPRPRYLGLMNDMTRYAASPSESSRPPNTPVMPISCAPSNRPKTWCLGPAMISRQASGERSTASSYGVENMPGADLRAKRRISLNTDHSGVRSGRILIAFMRGPYLPTTISCVKSRPSSVYGLT